MKDKYILFIDDEQMVRELFDYVLGDMGYKVMSFTDPVEAMNHYKDSHEDVLMVISDLSMPMMNGIQVVKSILDINKNEGIILLTGFYRADITYIKEKYNVEIVHKPPTKKDLSDAIERIIKRKG